MRRIIAGYTAAPSEPTAAATYYRALFAEPGADGLELAWKPAGGSLSEIRRLLADLPAHWRLTLNGIPSTFRAWKTDHTFGLASPEAEGRARAVAFARDVAEDIRRLNDLAGRPLVTAVELQSAPGFSDRTNTPDRDALARSLGEIAGLDWGDTTVALEHCDAYRPGRTPAKGFLELVDELAALTKVGSPTLGASLNWGRSVIELRDPERVVDHIAAARETGLLRGFTFSGTADADNAYGVAWADSHLPLADPEPVRFGEPRSLLTSSLAQGALEHLGDVEFLAVKTNWPADRVDPEERAASVVANFRSVLAHIPA